MPSIYVQQQPVYGRVLIEINFSDTVDTNARVRRVLDDGSSVVVRTNTFTDGSGDYIELSGGLAVLYDTEAPLDVPLVYIADGQDTGATATSSPSPGVVLASGSDLWLKAPLRPWADQRVVLEVPQEPDCLPESAIFFASMDVESRQNRTQVSVVNNRRNPIAMGRIRGGITSTLTVITRRFTDRDNVIALNAPGDPLMFQGPAQYGIPDQYMSVGDYQVARLTTDHRRQWRASLMPYTEIDRPAGLADGVLGNRWDDLCSPYATFADATSAGLTWSLVLTGQGSLVPSTPKTWTYASLPANYATYTALNAAFPTYTALWQGPF